MSGSILVVTFDTATGIRTGKLISSTLLEDNAVVSGKLATGAVGTTDRIADAIVASAKLTPTLIAAIEAGVVDGGVTSAKIASGAIGSVHIKDGAIGGVDLADLAVTSAKIGTTEVGIPHLADLAVVSAKIGALAVGTPHLAALGVTSGKIGLDAVGGAKVWDYGLVSGKYASGSITEQALISGISIDISELSEEPGYRAGDTISSFCCVYVAPISGNFVKIANALSGSMPAIGMTPAAITSGALGIINYAGRVAAPTAKVSGQFGKPVFVGTDGQLAVISGEVPATSGYCQQIMGTVKDDDEVFLFPEPGYIELT